MWNLLNKMPAYQARRWALVYFNSAVWVLACLLGLAVAII